jgi:organic hydroperoxide reductase OsmC/OhrA
MKEEVMNRLEKLPRDPHRSGRAGMSRSSGCRLEVRASRPGGPGAGINPEPLCAAGWSAYFKSTVEFAARNVKITLPADHTIDAEINVGPEGPRLARRPASTT